MEMKVYEALSLNQMLMKNDKTGKMGISKVTLVMMLVKFGKVAEEYNATQKEALEKLKKDYPDFDSRLIKAQEYEQALQDESKRTDETWTKEQYDEFMQNDYKAVIEPLEQAMKDEREKDVDVDYKKFDSQGYSEWMESNNVDAAAAAFWAKFLLEM